MSARDDNASPGEPSGKPKRGRPPGKRCNYTTQDTEGRIFNGVICMMAHVVWSIKIHMMSTCCVLMNMMAK